MKYIVKFGNRTAWNSQEDPNNEDAWVVTEDEIRRLSLEWDKPIEELMEQVEPN